MTETFVKINTTGSSMLKPVYFNYQNLCNQLLLHVPIVIFHGIVYAQF